MASAVQRVGCSCSSRVPCIMRGILLMHGITLCFSVAPGQKHCATQARQIGVRAGRGQEWACNARTPAKLYSSLLVLNPLHRIQCWLLKKQGQRTQVPCLRQWIWRRRCQSTCFTKTIVSCTPLHALQARHSFSLELRSARNLSLTS